MDNTTINEGKTTAIISYLWIIGFVIALILNNEKKNPFASFHLRQSLGIIVTWIAVWGVMSLLNVPALAWILELGLFVLWILGFISALQGEEKPVPLLGLQFQEWFKKIS